MPCVNWLTARLSMRVNFYTLVWVWHVAVVQAEIMSQWLPNALRTIQFDVWADPANGAAALGPPIQIGTALTLDCCSQFSRNGREFYRGYQMFADWTNMVRGGVSVQGVQRPIQLSLIDDHSSIDLVREITEHLVSNGTQIFLAPYSSTLTEPAADVVNKSGGIMIAAGASFASIFQDRPQVFGTHRPAHLWFEGTFIVWHDLGIRSVIAIQETAKFTKGVCSGLPGLTQKYGMTLTEVLTIPPDSDVSEFVSSHLSSLQELPDVLVGCTYSDVCKDILRGLRSHNLSFHALAFTVCVTSAGFLDELGDTARYVIGLTPWMPWFPMTSDITGWRSTDFATIYSERYGVAPPYQAATAFVSGIALVAAIEDANSTEPSAIAEALRVMNVGSMLGNLSFNHYGMSLNDMKAVQYQAEGNIPVLVSPATIRNQMVYPLPPWDDRDCFDAKLVRNTFGLDSVGTKHCHECPLGELSWWKKTVWHGSPAWQCLPINCSIGYRGRKDGSCSICEAGRYGTLSRTCEDCPVGAFSETDGATACSICEKGRFANATSQTACQLCSPGFEATREGLSGCRPCRLGTNSSTMGAVNCELCKEGTISNTTASRTCIQCDPGRYSAWGAQSCDACQIGKYQEAFKQSSCNLCPNGTSCNQEGTLRAANLPDWWALNYTKDGKHHRSWHACSHSGFCLAEERCAEGHTGLLCKACLPGYSFNAMSKRCSTCPAIGVNILTCLLLAVLVFIFTILLTAWSIMAATQAKAITSALLKLLLNYITTMSIMGNVLYRELNDKAFLQSSAHPNQQRDDSWLEVPKFFSAEVLSWQSSIFSLECLVQPSLTDQDLAIVNSLAEVPHSLYLSPQYSEARRILTTFHYDLEVHRLVFWVLLPWILSFLLVLFGLLRLKCFIACNREFFKEAEYFVHDIEVSGWKIACRTAANKGQDYHKFLAFNDKRLMGIWRAIDYRGNSSRKFWSKFRRECEPLVLIILFLAYPYCMKAYLRPLSCMKPLSGLFGSRMESAIDVECYDNDTLFWFSLVLIVVFGLGLPVGSGMMLYEHREKLHKPRFQRTYGFMTGGYEVDRNWWECGILVRKSVSQIVASLGMHQGIRILLVITASSTFTLLHIWYQPFDNRFNELLDRIEFRHLICWVTFGLVLLAMHMLPTEVPSQTIWIFLIFLLLVHVWFLFMMLKHVLRHMRNNFAEGILFDAHHDQYVEMHGKHMTRRTSQTVIIGEQGEGGEPEFEVPSDLKFTPAEVLRRGKLPRVKRMILQTYVSYLDHQAYVAFHNEMLWCQILGNMGSACVVPDSFVVTETMESLLVSMPSNAQLPAGVDLSSEESRLYMVKIIMEVFEYIIVNQEISVFSSTLLEFVFRAGLAFGSDGKQRHILVSRAHTDNRESELGNFDPITGVFNAAGGAVDKITSVTQGGINAAIGFFSTGNRDSGQDNRNSVSSDDSFSDVDAQEAEALEQEVRDADIKKKSARLMKGGTQDTIISAVAKEAQFECAELVRLMFEPSIFLRGLTLQDFQLNLAASVMTKSKKELRMWFETFEAEWQRRKLLKYKQIEEQEAEERKAAIERVDAETQVDANEIMLALEGKTPEDLGPTACEANWHRFARQLVLIVARRHARQPALFMMVKSQRRLAPIEQQEQDLMDELAKLGSELDRLTITPSGGDDELLKVSNELAAARAEHAQVTKEILQLREECVARGIELPGNARFAFSPREGPEAQA